MPPTVKQPISNDPRTLVEGAWRQIYTTDAGRHPNQLAPGAPRFIDYAWKTFDPKTVMKILTSEEPTYAARKPILFSGLCTWVACPMRHSLRQHGMLLVGIEHLRAAEAEGRKVFAGRDLPGHELLGDILGRVRVLGQDFFSDFYYPIGGLAQVLRSTTPGNFRRSLAKHAEAARTAVTMMEIYDYHARHLNDPKRFYQASEGKGYKLVRIIYARHRKEMGFSVELSEDRWRKLGLSQTAAMSYAASTLPAGKADNLLNAIVSGTASFEDHGHLLPAWIGRARYAAEVILRGLTKSEIGQINAGWLPDLPTEPTPEPPLSAPERAEIEAEFDISAILGARWKALKQVSSKVPPKPASGSSE